VTGARGVFTGDPAPTIRIRAALALCEHVHMRRAFAMVTLASSIAFFACGGGAQKPAGSATPPAASSSGPAAASPSGSLMGDHPGDSFGFGGLGVGNIGDDGRGLGKPGSAKVEDGALVATGKLPPDVIKRIVRANYPRFRACYEHGLTAHPELKGIVAVEFVIDESGAVLEAKRGAASTLKDDDVGACVVGVYRSLSFPEPEGGKVHVTYPIDFQND
jgi:hypothetical protein